MRVNWALSEPGVYAAQYEPPDAGDYTVTATATLKKEAPLTASTTFSVGETLDEYADSGQKVELLRQIASTSGGRYFEPQEARELPRLLEQSVGEKRQKETVYDQHDIWDTPLGFGLIAAALTAEWILRRRASLI
jgi:hypothetical protein